MRQAELIYNPRGGQVVVRRELETVVAFLKRCDWEVTYRETTKPKEATQLAREAAQKGVEVVIAAGGDGTVSEIANGLVNSGTVLGVLPVGTTNSWALQVGIPALNPFLPGTNVAKMVSDLEGRIARPLPANYYRRKLLEAARVLVEGKTQVVDLGEVSGCYFLMWAGIGLDAAVLESISWKDKRMLGSWAYLLTAIRTLSHYSSKDVRLVIDGEAQEVNTPLIVVSNIQLYGGMMPIGANARVNDGKLDVCIFKGEGFFTFVQHALSVLSHKHLKDPKIEYHQCREITIESAGVLPVHVDAEPYTTTPVTIRCKPSALKVIVPKKTPGNLFGLFNA